MSNHEESFKAENLQVLFSSQSDCWFFEIQLKFKTMKIYFFKLSIRTFKTKNKYIFK